MEKTKVDPSKYLSQVDRVLKKIGLLLVSTNKEGTSNVMTIGWGLFGILWNMDFVMVAVRPSRHTFNFIEETGEFTINVPTLDLADVLEYCGTVSGRDEDKFVKMSLDLLKGTLVSAPIIKQCCLHFECQVTYKTRLIQESIPKEIILDRYPEGDFHTIYFGKILNVLADKDISSKIKLF
ncbi:MAG: flavin reductase family protein [Candidatus Bathyarchaeota archaeon]|nr:flavin reductase family protein [Candidatus Bathyarchaeota archaeon]